jgi:ribosomal protein L9
MSPANRESFQRIIRDTGSYSHAQVASALREIGYDVDRKQVQHFRERLKLGKVAL